MAITVKHTKVSTVPDGDDTSVVRPSDWNDDHALTGLGTMAEQNANAVAITGGTISGVTLPASNITGTLDVGHGGTGATTLTGYVKGTGTAALTASSTIPNTDITGLGTASTKDAGVANGVATLDSGGQVPLSQLPPLGDLNYQGTWNATTNTPTLTSSVGTKGYYYVVSVAGTTNLNGITDWQIGDWAVFNGSVWQKVDNTDAVTSVNGYTGTVVLNAADVGAVPYTGATGAVDLNAKTLVNVSNLGVNTTTVPTIKIRAVGDNNSSSRIAMRGYSSDANSSAIRVSKFRGTVAAPQAPISGDSLGKFELAGYGTTSADAYPQSSLEGVATENWGATARGAKAVVKVTPNTTTTQVTALTIDQDSKATFANTVTANGVLLTGNTGTVTSVAATAGTGISVSGSPITTSGTLTITNTAPDQTVAISAGTGISTSGTYPNFTVTNTAPDQTVALTAGTGISTSGTYPNFTITNTSPSSGGTVTSVTGTAPIVSSGGNTPAISIPTATTSVNGYLTSTDWNTFNGKQPAGTYVNSVSGTTGRITSTGGTTPVIDLASGVATAGTTGSSTLIPVVTIDTYGRVTGITTAANPQGTVTSVTGTAPVVSSGGATPAISMAAATSSVNGYLTSTDWTTFNNKAPAFTYTTGYIPFGQGTTTPNQSGNLFWDNTNVRLGIANVTPRYLLDIGGAYAGVGLNLSGVTGAYTIYQGTPDGSGFFHSKIVSERDASTYSYAGYLAFYTEYKNAANSTDTSAERMRLWATGGLSLGNTTDPGATNLSVTGNGSFGGQVSGASSVSATSVATLSATAASGDQTYLSFTAGATKIGSMKRPSGENNIAISAFYSGVTFYTGTGGAGTETQKMQLSVAGGLSIGNTTDAGVGGLRLSGLMYPQQAATASAPAYVKGAIYFDTTLNKLRVGGATAWETITSI